MLISTLVFPLDIQATAVSQTNACLISRFDFQAELIRRDYVANGGWETFLSYEDPEQDILIGL